MRHPLIFSTFNRMGPEDSLYVVNDHDPRPLRYLFDVKYPNAFTWDYVEEGPDIWRVRIGRTAEAYASPVRREWSEESVAGATRNASGS